MKKSLTALAVLGAFAGSAFAANVTMYGAVDTGLMYTHTKQDVLKYKATTTNQVKEDALAMESGINAATHFGIKGTEDLGNGLTVGFKLENGFSSDTGKLGNGERLFGRESSVSLYGDFGTLSMGRMGGVASSAGTYDIVFATADAFDGLDNNVGGLMISSRYDNMITYQTPEFAGAKVTAQYSFKGDADAAGDEGKSSADRYASLAAHGTWGDLSLVAAYEWQNWGEPTYGKTTDLRTPERIDDQHTFYVGGNYDLGVTKVFALGQYFNGARNLNSWAIADENEKTPIAFVDGIKGYGLHVGAVTPVMGGDWTVAVYYTDAQGKGRWENAAAGVRDLSSADYKYFGFSTKYAYALSKRTSLYAGAGYAKEELDSNDYPINIEKDVIQVYAGLTHRF